MTLDLLVLAVMSVVIVFRTAFLAAGGVLLIATWLWHPYEGDRRPHRIRSVLQRVSWVLIVIGVIGFLLSLGVRADYPRG